MAGGNGTKTYLQPDARETEQFWTKIWQRRGHNKKAEWINNMTKELVFEESLKAEIRIDLLKTTLKNIKLENARPWCNTRILVQEIRLHSRQTSIRNEQMPTRSTRTRMDDSRKDHIDPEGAPQGNRPKQLQIHCACLLCGKY